jgi:ribosome-binding factor A
VTARTDRIDELFRQEINEILTKEVDDAKIGFATITGVETQPDLRHAKVLVSVIGSPETRRATISAMGRHMPFIRHELGKRLRMKRIPEFHLELDETLERGTRVLHILDEIGAGNAPTDEAPKGETLLDRVKAASLPVVAIGKIEDLFAGRGVTHAIHTASDDEGMDQVERQMQSLDRGFVFTNLVDFDSQYGHRNDVEGYARNLERFDARLAGVLPRLRETDLLQPNSVYAVGKAAATHL